MKKSMLVILTVLLAASLLLISCTKKVEEKAAETQTKKFKIAMVTDVGGVNDQSFNQSAWEGLQRAEKELSVKASYIESNQDADYLPNLETLYDAENDIIWGIGFKMADKIKEAAIKNPEQKYAIIDFTYGKDTPENVVCVLFKEQEASFLVGYIAAKMSKTNKIGFVGGMDFPVIHRFKYGFLAGVKQANPKAEVFSQYAGSFTDAAKGKAITKQMFQKNADIVFHAAGGVGDGVIEAAKEVNKFAIGVDRDQSDLAPENVVTSAMKRVDNAIFSVAKKLVNGKWEGGTTISYGLNEKGVDIAPTSDKLVPAEILEEVKVVKEKIINKEIKVPASEESYNKFLEGLK